MPNVARSRVIGASADRVWELVADPHNLPRWWPETSRVEDVEGAPGARRSRFTQVMKTSKGRTVRADFRCTASTEGRAHRLEPAARGHPVRGVSPRGGARGPARPRRAGRVGRRDERHGRGPAQAARHVAARLADDAAGDRPDAEPGARRDRAAVAGRRDRHDVDPRPMLRRDTAFDRWGEEGQAPELGAAAAGDARRADRRRRSRWPRVPLESIDASAGRSRSPMPWSRRRAGRTPSASSDEDRIRHAAGKGYPDLIRMRAAAHRAAPDAVLAPADADAVAAVLAACSNERIAVVPFGGGTSVVGGVDPERGAFERLVSLDLTALREVDVDPISMTARLGPGLRGPGGGGGAERGRLHARALPAVLPLRDDRRLRRDPLRGPGVERIRALRCRSSPRSSSPPRSGSMRTLVDAAHGRRAVAARARRSARRASSA